MTVSQQENIYGDYMEGRMSGLQMLMEIKLVLEEMIVQWLQELNLLNHKWKVSSQMNAVKLNT